MIDAAMPWYELATAHYAIAMVIGAAGGYLLKFVADDLSERGCERRRRLRDQVENLIDASIERRLACAGDQASMLQIRRARLEIVGDDGGAARRA